MMVMAFENVSPSLRGELSRWLLEVQTNVFLGSVSSVVRDKLWDLAVEKAGEGHCSMMYKTNSEQGFDICTHGPSRRVIEDFEGLKLVRYKKEKA